MRRVERISVVFFGTNVMIHKGLKDKSVLIPKISLYFYNALSGHYRGRIPVTKSPKLSDKSNTIDMLGSRLDAMTVQSEQTE